MNRAEPDQPVMNRRMNPSTWLLTPLLGLVLATAAAAGSYEEPPINYNTAAPADPVARLQKQIDAGRVKLDREDARGYLPSLLKHLNVPVSSQSLVFSKTSFQRDRISPKNPRAL